MCLLCRSLRWYLGTPEYNKEFIRITSKKIIKRCMTLLDYFHIVHVYWCLWEDSWEQEDPLYIFHNVARIYIRKISSFILRCAQDVEAYTYIENVDGSLCPILRIDLRWLDIHLQLRSTKQYTCSYIILTLDLEVCIFLVGKPWYCTNYRAIYCTNCFLLNLWNIHAKWCTDT